MSASVTFALKAAKTQIFSLGNVDVSPAPQWTVISGASTVTPAGDGLSAAWLGAPVGDTTVVTLVSFQNGVQDTKTITAITYDDGSGGAVAGPDVSIGSPA